MKKQSNAFLIDLAKAFKKGGVVQQYNFPGFHSHELFSCLGGGITSTNEKIAYEVAWGASQAGRKSLVTFKNVGLNDAADPFINSYLTGVGSGLVLVIFDDIELEGSQCILDSRHYFSFYGGLWLEPYNYASAIVFAKAAPKLSEIFNIPVVVRLTNASVSFKKRGSVSYTAGDICKLAEGAMKEQQLMVEPIVHPVNGDHQRKIISKKNQLIKLFVDGLQKMIHASGSYTIINAGIEGGENSCPIATLPVPRIDQSKLKKVQEVGDPVVANWLALASNKPSFKSVALGYNSQNAAHYIRTKRYERLFRLLKPHYKYITGDLGEYTKDTLDTLTHCLCFGSAISTAIGMSTTGSEVLAITGDASFFHSAKNAIQEGLDRDAILKVVLLDNGGSQGTGGQRIPGKLDKTVQVLELNYDTVSDSELNRIVEQFTNEPAPTILKVNHKV